MRQAVIVGAGPVGLLLAIELRLGGVDVLVLERLASPSVTIKATAVGPLGAEALQRRGMGPALAEAEDRTFEAMGPMGVRRRAQAQGSRGGHFAAIPFRSDVVREPERRYVWVDQQGLDAILFKRAADLGIEVRREADVVGIDTHDDAIAVHWTSPGGPRSERCSWLVGCDGGRSSIRKMAGFEFPGTAPSITMYQALLDIDHPDRLPRGMARLPQGGLMYGPRPRRLVMHDFEGPPADREAPVTHEEIEGVLRRISGADVRVTAIEQANRFTDSARLVHTYRLGRVLLAGDAAHIHSPLGGQGLSLGLVDAANLGWKLAAVIRGDKPETLLESYTSERRPVAAAVLDNTLAQVALTRPDPHSSALRELFERLMEFDQVSRHLDGLTSGLATRYTLGSELDAVGCLTGDRPLRDADLESSLFAQMTAGDGILLDASRGPRLARVAAGFTRLRILRTGAGTSMLIRPDGCIAWTGDADDTKGLSDALERWFSPGRREEAEASLRS